MSEQLNRQLAQVRRKQRSISLGQGIALICIFLVVALAVDMLMDWTIELPWSSGVGLPWIWRLLMLAAIVSGGVYIAWRKILRPVINAPDNETLALAVERHETDFAGRLIASVQLSKPDALTPGASAALVRQVVVDTEAMARDRDFNSVVNADLLVRLGAVALLVMLIGAVAFAILRPASGALLERAMLGNVAVPRKTQIEPVTGNARVPRGESVSLVVAAHGVKPSSGTLYVEYPKAEYDYKLNADPDIAGRYSRKIDNVTDTFSYMVRLNDARSERYTVEAVDRPAAMSMQCVQIFPQYTHHKDETHLPGDLTLLAGSRLEIRLKSNKSLARTTPMQFPFNRVHLSGSDRDYPLDVSGDDAASAQSGMVDGQRGIPLPLGTTGLCVYLVDQDNLESRNPTVYRVELKAKEPPKIVITSPEARDEMVVARSVQPIDFDARDDFGISAVSLCYKVDGGAEQQLPITIVAGAEVAGRYNFALSSISPSAGKSSLDGSTVEYWLRAMDTNTLTNADHKPGQRDSEPRQSVRIVSEAEFTRAQLNAASTTIRRLDPVSQGEHQSSDDLGNFVMSHGATTQPATQP